MGDSVSKKSGSATLVCLIGYIRRKCNKLFEELAASVAALLDSLIH